MREFHDEEENVIQDKKNTASAKRNRGNSKDKHAKSETVQLPETHKSERIRDFRDISEEQFCPKIANQQDLYINKCYTISCSY